MMMDEATKTMEAATATVRVGHGVAVSASPVWSIALGAVFVEMSHPLRFGVEVRVDFSIQGGLRTVRHEGLVIWTTRQYPSCASGKAGIAVLLKNVSIAEMKFVAGCVRKSEFVRNVARAHDVSAPRTVRSRAWGTVRRPTPCGE